MKRIFLILGLLAVIGCASTRAFACSCAGGSAPCQEYWEASAVFIGTVIEDRLVTFKEGDRIRQTRAVRISIDEAFRGVEGGEVEVLTALGEAACGFGFRRTQQYLVYAYRSESDQKLHTSICTRTRAISEADADLVYIRGLSKAKPGGTISGQVFRYSRNDEGTLNNQPLAGVRVTIAGPEKHEAVTDAKGEFRNEGIQPGEYTVVPVPPKGLAVGGPDRKITVSDRGCGTVSFWLRSSAQVSGRVLNPAGLPVKNAELSIILAGKNQGRSDVAFADENGVYRFKMIPPGRYVIQIRHDGMSSQTRPFPVIYYPGTPYKSQARVFTIEEGEAIDLDVQVPPMPAESEIRGQVVWQDGKPAATARLYMLFSDGNDYGVKVDEEGRFSVKVYNGMRVVLGASAEITKDKHASGNSGPIVAGVNTDPIKLVLVSPQP
jgi:hypothetical protein